VTDPLVYMAGESTDKHESRLEQIKACDVILAYERTNAETVAECAVATLIGKPFFLACNRERFPLILASYAKATFYPIRERDQAMYLTKQILPVVTDPVFITVANNLERVLELVESPMEQRLAVYLANAGIEVNAQHEIQFEKKTYRLDFAVESMKIAIEVDGHDFHERTKDQAQRDKSRDRALQILGWRTLRFTGSEVFRDAAACAGEVVQVMEIAP